MLYCYYCGVKFTGHTHTGLIDCIINLGRNNKRLLEAFESALLELGEPQAGYPAPVANAANILQSAYDEFARDKADG